MLDEHQYNFAAVVASTLLAGIFQATKFPERLSPGEFAAAAAAAAVVNSVNDTVDDAAVVC